MENKLIEKKMENMKEILQEIEEYLKNVYIEERLHKKPRLSWRKIKKYYEILDRIYINYETNK